MAGATLGTVLHHIRHLVAGSSLGERTDAQLLECFAKHQDEAAFEALVRRHGPMVHGVCRRTLNDPHDVEDAFQATFLVLVRKARSIGRRELVGNWLYGVAYRVALKARARAAKRRSHERQVEAMPEIELPESWTDRDLRRALDEEVHRLPMKYRAAVVLCYLEGKSSEEAAGLLHCPTGTVKSRLSRARDLLRDRFARRGLALSAGAVAVLLAEETASASVPGQLVTHTVQAALVVAAEATTAGVVSASVATLTEGVIQAMFLNKLKIAAAMLLAVSVVGAGVGILTHRALAEKPAAAKEKPTTDKPAEAAAKPEKPGQKGDAKEGKKEQAPTVSGVVTKADAGANTITLTVGSKGKEKQPEEQTFPVAADAKVYLPTYTKKDEPPQGKLADLRAGQQVHLHLSADKKTVVRIDIQTAYVNGTVKAVDAGKNTLTINLMDKKSSAEQTYTLAADAKVYLPSKNKTKDKETKETPEGKLTDLTEGVPVSLALSFDQKTAHIVSVHAPSVSGNVKAVDAGKSTITLVSKGKEQAAEQTYIVAGDVKIYLPSMNKAAKETKEAVEGKLADLSEGLGVVMTLSLDRKMVEAIQVQVPSAGGNVKKVDAAQGTITIAQKNDEQTYQLAKDAKITLVDGKNVKEGKLADLTEGMSVVLLLSLDKKTVLGITVQAPSVQGGVKGVNAGNHTITIGGKGDDDKTYAVAKDADIVLAGVAKGQKGTLADLPEGSQVVLQLSLDRQTVIGIAASGPGVNGTVKSIDAGNRTITIEQKGGEQSFTLAKEVSLTDVAAGVEVSLQLSVDKATVVGLHIHKDKK